MNSHRLAWQLPLLILLTLPLWHGAMTRFLTLEQSPTTAPLRQDSSFMLEEFVFSEVNHHGDALALKAKRMNSRDQASGFNLEGIDARRLGTEPLHITGNSASFDPERQILTILDTVVVETAKLVVKTEAMRYLVKYETLKSAAEIELHGEGMDLSGTSFMYNLNTGALRVGQRVRFRYTPVTQSPTNQAP
jgi:LPS export ABC transporter protein LptC